MADPIEIINTVEVTTYLGPLVAVDSDQLKFLVELTNGVVTDAWASPPDSVWTDPTTCPAWVRVLALEVAGRPARNPKGLASWTKSADDASKTERLPERAAAAGVFLTSEEAARLGGVKRRRRRMGTIYIRRGY